MNSKAVLVLSVAIYCAGCHEMIDPWTDETVGPELVTTASVQGARAQTVSAPASRRTIEAVAIAPQDGTVSHFPLGFQDPFETPDETDRQFAWGPVDYFLMPYGLSRFIVNTIGMPLTVAMYPPVPLRGSDGVSGQEGWAARSDPQWLPAGGVPTPPDVLEIGAVPVADE